MDNPWKHLSNINPQREAGHREISNEVYAALIRADLTGGEYKIALSVIEKTWGFNKKSDRISCSQFSELTGLSGRSVNVIIKNLKEKRVIYYEPSRVNGGSPLNCGSPLNEFIFNKHYDTWLRVKCASGVKRSSGVKQTVVKGEANGILRVKRSSATKETITKEKKEKATISYSDEFLEFYRAYPNKKEKPEAWIRWKELGRGRPVLSILIDAIKKQKRWRENSNGNFRPEWKHPGRWLKKGCWEDEVDVEESKPFG